MQGCTVLLLLLFFVVVVVLLLCNFGTDISSLRDSLYDNGLSDTKVVYGGLVGHGWTSQLVVSYDGGIHIHKGNLETTIAQILKMRKNSFFIFCIHSFEFLISQYFFRPKQPEKLKKWRTVYVFQCKPR